MDNNPQDPIDRTYAGWIRERQDLGHDELEIAYLAGTIRLQRERVLRLLRRPVPAPAPERSAP